MKRKYLILTSFLMLFYMGPLLLAPSSVGVPILTEQNTGNDFLLADCFWLDGWDYRKNVSITGVSGAGTDYQVFLNVTYDSDMQEDFDDLRFTNEAGVPLDYWTESYAVSAYAYVWVEVTANLDSDQTIDMYYGNATVSNASNGTATFLFYEDWSSESVDPLKWDTITSDGSIAFDDTDAEHGSVIQVSGNAGSDVYELRSVPTSAAPVSIIGRVKIEPNFAASQRTMWGMGNTATLPMAFIISNEGDENFQVVDEDSHDDSQILFGTNFDTYHSFMITRDGTTAKMYRDYVLITAADCDADIIGAANVITIYVRDSEYSVYMDWSAQRKFIADGPTGGVFGDEEDEEEFPPPTWVAVNTARFIFPVGWDPTFQFGYDMFFIALGLIMIPFSTLYLVRGGMKEMSRDKLFLGLIIFVMGFGLLIGGIMP